MKKFFFFKVFVSVIVIGSSQIAISQTIATADHKKLHLKEDSLQILAKDLIVDTLTAGRMRSDSQFVRTLVRALQIKNSFYYPFDSIAGVSKLYAPDTSFRIFTWSLSFNDYYARQRGAIQLKTIDGSLKLLPLRDYSEFTKNLWDSVRTRNNWVGAVYYRIIKTVYNGKNYYTLFGFDDNSARTSRKWIEVMTFNPNNEPVFGGPYFSFEEDSLKRPTLYRYSIEYKKEASTMVNYEDDLKVILVDHLISESDEPENKWTFVPDGDYEGFKWKNGKWVHVDKVFTQKLQDGEAPVPDPVMDSKGKKNEEKLQEKSDKNKGKPGKG